MSSSSVRRFELLKSIGYLPDDVFNPKVDEKPNKNEKPFELVKRLAIAKVNNARKNYKNSFIIGADTLVECAKSLLTKTENKDQARIYLQMLSGRRHRVFTGFALLTPNGEIYVDFTKTIVKFKKLSISDLEEYLASNEWMGKAGGYGIQGKAACFVSFLSGSYSNVVGLPLYETCKMLQRNGCLGSC